MNSLETQLKQASDLLQAESAICAAFLHGSGAKGTLRADSDIDIALLLYPAQELPAEKRLALAEETASVFGRTVDLGILSTNNLVYAKEVIEHGKILFSKNRFLSERFLSTCLSLYAALQHERKEVLLAYSA
jgi:uncharacterized protein